MYLVIFRNRKRADIDAEQYARDAQAMEELARSQPGYRAFKSYTSEDGEVVAISEWDDEASARAWGKQAEHLIVQGRGREEYYEEYTLFGANDPRVHEFKRET